MKFSRDKISWNFPSLHATNVGSGDGSKRHNLCKTSNWNALILLY